MVYDYVDPALICLGNHDVALVKQLLNKDNYELSIMSSTARQGVINNAKLITPESGDLLIRLFQGQRYILKNDQFTFSHSVPSTKLNLWAYLTKNSSQLQYQKDVAFHKRLYYSPDDVIPYIDTSVAFIGHNHKQWFSRTGDTEIISVGTIGRFGNDLQRSKWVVYPLIY